MENKLVFVYNANSGTKNALLDVAHKILSPSTYSCNLCDITYGVFTENSVWREFRETAPLEMQFLHKDEFVKSYDLKLRYKFEYPIVLLFTNGVLEILVATSELNNLKTPQDLISLVEKRIGITCLLSKQL